MKNAISWFEIPSVDYARAVKFYSEIIGKELINADMEGFKMSMFPYDEKGGVGGAVIYTENIKPSFDGITVYINAGDDIDSMIGRIEKSGCKIIISKMDIGQGMGFMIQFIDTEGNRVGVHGMK